MKLKQIAAVVTIIIAALMLWVHIQIGKEENNTIDMVFYNGEVKQIEEALAEEDFLEEAVREEVEQEFSCEILLRTDEDYVSRLHQCLEKESIILDYEKDGEIIGKIIWQEKSSKYDAMRERLHTKILTIGALLLIIIYITLFIIYQYYVKPFKTLQEFSAEIAKGNLERHFRLQSIISLVPLRKALI